MLRWTTAGESHGRAVIAIIEGLPAGLRVEPSDIDRDLARRQAGYGRGGRMKIERDRAQVLSGLRGGVTLGSPVAVLIENRDWENWTERMDPWDPAALGSPEMAPRPGHADLAGSLKFGHSDMRSVLERASARETAARVAVGALARRFLREMGIEVGSQVTAIGNAGAASPGPAGGESIASWQGRVDQSPVRCACPEASREMVRAIDRAREEGYSLGGQLEVRTSTLPPGLGSYTGAGERLDARLAGGMMSIPGIKGVEIGDAFRISRLPGSEAHDDIVPGEGGLPLRPTNRAGGLEGGVTNGQPLIVRLAMKPIATQAQPLGTVDMGTGRSARAFKERADTCAVPAAGVVAEAVACLVLAQAAREKFGGDSADDARSALSAYMRRVGDLPWIT